LFDIKSNKGRTYMTVALRNNIVRWSAPFLERVQRAGSQEPLAGLTVGYPLSHDPGELIVAAEGNTLEALRGYRDAPALVIHAAQFNSQRIVNRRTKLTATAPAGTPGRRASRSKTNASRH
jgi:hypothetical protein